MIVMAVLIMAIAFLAGFWVGQAMEKGGGAYGQSSLTNRERKARWSWQYNMANDPLPNVWEWKWLKPEVEKHGTGCTQVKKGRD